ncbi:acVLRF1 family peptidyl-tRNA hydrolase [Vallicoccus soli]|uniref:acVLRF1 family peptidyl-tRNA hydrolase n=1 Tax=Vallicoccus soli TaxID=2339232 RepID=UPI0014036EB2|nr:acVLRF1 family peptidyl-tRNA hydrolase [Vallicoccus soli]
MHVAPERLERWLATFAERHGGAAPRDGRWVAGDGSWAVVGDPPPARLGLLLVRRGGFAAGVADGPRLVASKVGRRRVQGRTAAGGWSQQRFARRREGQARELAGAAADLAARLLLPAAYDLLVTGGDRPLVGEVLADPRLAPLRPLVAERVLDVPDPRLDVLRDALATARAVPVRVHDVLRDGPPAP